MARLPPHQTTGLPSSSTCRWQLLSGGASQPWVPGWMSFCASTPTGRLRSSQPAGLEA
jgi:hypothetical protein